MPQLQNWIKIGVLLVFSSAALCCAVLGIHILTKDEITKAGIATLTFHFNLTDISISNPLLRSGVFPHSFQSEAQSVASFLNTAVSAASSKVQGATGAIATAITTAVTNSTAIEAMIPRHCSLGTKHFCLIFDTNTTCHGLPLNISSIIPEAITKLDGDEFKSLLPLEGILAKVTLASIQGSVILGLILMLCLMLMLTGLFFSLSSFETLLLKLGANVVSVFCFCFFLFPYLTYVLCPIQDPRL
jgi:hypothetical protein